MSKRLWERYKENINGFTLIELLVVISIISLLASIVFASLNSARVKARDTRRKADLHELQTALELFYDAYGAYPVFQPSSSCAGGRNDWATSYCTNFSWLTADTNFSRFMPTVPRDPLNTLSTTFQPGSDVPWWEAFTYTYGVNADRQIYDLLASLESPSDRDRCEFKIWKSQAVWPGEPGCWSSGVLLRSDQIYSVK